MAGHCGCWFRGEIQFVTARCFQGRLLMRPSLRTNASSSEGRLRGLPDFTTSRSLGSSPPRITSICWFERRRGTSLGSLKHLRGNISKKVGWLIKWSGCFWERRYSVEFQCSTMPRSRGRIRYMIAHGVKRGGLVRRRQDWPGLNSLRLMLTGGRAGIRGSTGRATVAQSHVERGAQPDEFRSGGAPEKRLFPWLPFPAGPGFQSMRQGNWPSSGAAAINRDGLATFEHVLGIRGVPHPESAQARGETDPAAASRAVTPQCGS